jgi:catecholate siderophore receptor
VGLASALAAGGALAQEPAAAPPAAPAVQEAPAAAAAEQAAPAPQGAPGEAADYTLPGMKVEEAAEGYKEESQLVRLPTALVDTPQTVTVVPKVVLEEQRATTVRDALRNISGITIAAGEGGRQGDAFSLRGFSAQNDVARDGVRDLGFYTRDTFNLSTVEAFFGPSAVLFGRGSTGGVLNLVTKRPTRRTFLEARADAGSAPYGRLELDANQSFSDDFQVRISGAGQLSGVAGREVAQRNRGALAPSARLALGASTTLEADYLFQHEESVPDYGQPFVAQEPNADGVRVGTPVSMLGSTSRNAFYGVAGSDTERANAHVLTGRLLQELGGGFRLTNTLRFGAVDRFARPTALRAVPNRTDVIGRQRFESDTDNAYLVNQTDVRGAFDTGFLRHTASAGLELTREQRATYRDNLVDAAGVGTNRDTPADMYAPVAPADLSGVSRVFNSASTTRQWNVGAYLSDQVAVTKWLEVLGTARFDVFDTRYTLENAQRAVNTYRQQVGLFNWRTGVVVHPMESTSLYAMVGTSTNPSAELGTLSDGTVSVEPETNRTLEVGAKADVLEQRLSLSAAVFRTDKLNARVPNPDTTITQQVLLGRQRVQGFNAAVAGTVVGTWKAFANYTFMGSEVRAHSNPFLVGQVLPNTPEHSFSLWSTVSPLAGLTLGGGAVYQSEMTVNNPANDATALNKVPGFVRLDAVATYAFGQASVQLNVNNITDALYYDQFAPSRAVPADGRSAVLSAKYRF